MNDVFNIDDIREFTDTLAGFNSREVNKKVRKMLQTEGNKLKKETVKLARTRVKKKTGNYIKGIKRGKVYLYQGDTWSIRAYNNQPHAHLIEYGHDIVRGGKKGAGGRIVGYQQGKKVFTTAERRFKEKYFKDVEKFVDEILNEGLGF